MNITVNIGEVASELAHKEVERYFNFDNKKIYEWVCDEEKEAQDIFNQFYDRFYYLLWNLKED